MQHNRTSPAGLQRVALITFLFLLGIWASGAVVVPAKAASPKPAQETISTTRNLPRIVDVGADKCVPCIMMAPILEELKKEYAGILRVEFVDAWKNPEAANRYGVRGIPTQIFYDASGKELGRHLGFLSKEGILKRFEDLGVSIRKPPKK